MKSERCVLVGSTTKGSSSVGVQFVDILDDLSLFGSIHASGFRHFSQFDFVGCDDCNWWDVWIVNKHVVFEQFVCGWIDSPNSKKQWLERETIGGRKGAASPIP